MESAVKKLPEIFKKIREDNNLTQRELAKRIKGNHSYISLIEQGKKIPGKDIIKRVENEFNLKIENLLINRQIDLSKIKSGSELFKEVRLQNNLTQRAMAEKLNSSTTYISEIENGRKNAGNKITTKLAKSFQLPVEQCLNIINKKEEIPKQIFSKFIAIGHVDLSRGKTYDIKLDDKDTTYELLLNVNKNNKISLVLEDAFLKIKLLDKKDQTPKINAK